MNGLLLHFSIPKLSISATYSTIFEILLVVVLDILGVVFEILGLDVCIITFFLEDYDILKILTNRLGQLFWTYTNWILLCNFRIKAIFQNLETKEILILQIVEKHFCKIHCQLESFCIWKRWRIQENLHILLFDVISWDQCLFWWVLWIANLLVYCQKSLQSFLPNSVVDIHRFCQGFDVILFGSIEITNLKLKLQPFEIVDILEKMILFEKLQPKSLLLFHLSQSLLVLDGFIYVHVFVGCLFENGHKLYHFLLQGFDLHHIAVSLCIHIKTSVLVESLLFRHFVLSSFQVTSMLECIICHTNNNVDFKCHKLLHEDEVWKVWNFAHFSCTCIFDFHCLFIVEHTETLVSQDILTFGKTNNHLVICINHLCTQIWMLWFELLNKMLLRNSVHCGKSSFLDENGCFSV